MNYPKHFTIIKTLLYAIAHYTHPVIVPAGAGLFTNLAQFCRKTVPVPLESFRRGAACPAIDSIVKKHKHLKKNVHLACNSPLLCQLPPSINYVCK